MLTDWRLEKVAAPWIDLELPALSMSSKCAATDGHSYRDSCPKPTLACLHLYLGQIGHWLTGLCHCFANCFD